MTCRFKVAAEKIILVTNLLVYRVDALLANIVDGALILSYRALIDLILDSRSNWFPFVISLPVVSHILYIIVYLINDLIDYDNPHGLKRYLDNSFYRLRPIYYFQKSKPIIAYTFLLYTAYIILILTIMHSLFYLSIFFVLLVMILSIAHSLYGATVRVATFHLLRLIKYTYMLMLFNIVAFNNLYDQVTILVMLTLVFPYVTYSVISYGRLIESRNKTGAGLSMSILAVLFITLLIIFFKATPAKYQLISLVKASITGYLLIVLPIFSVRQILRKIFGPANPTYYHHLLRLILGTLLTIFIITIFFYILNLIMS